MAFSKITRIILYVVAGISLLVVLFFYVSPKTLDYENDILEHQFNRNHMDTLHWLARFTDPHEIANVMGLDGVRIMLDDATRSPLGVFVMASSCVPATAMPCRFAHRDI